MQTNKEGVDEKSAPFLLFSCLLGGGEPSFCRFDEKFHQKRLYFYAIIVEKTDVAGKRAPTKPFKAFQKLPVFWSSAPLISRAILKGVRRDLKNAILSTTLLSFFHILLFQNFSRGAKRERYFGRKGGVFVRLLVLYHRTFVCQGGTANFLTFFVKGREETVVKS